MKNNMLYLGMNIKGKTKKGDIMDCKKNCGKCDLASFTRNGVYCESKGEYVKNLKRTKRIKQIYTIGNYQKIKAIQLLNQIINNAKDLTPGQIQNERYEIPGEIHSEIFNFLQNNNLDKFN
jgi:hypothetical protein